MSREAQRKSENLITISKQEVHFALQSSYMRNRYPSTTFAYFVDLLGKKVQNPVVQRFQHMFPQYTLVPDPFDGSVSFIDSEGNTYSTVELVAMQLAETMKIASRFAEEPVTDAIITVPPYFNQVERSAMMRAADLAGINLISLMNDNTAGESAIIHLF
ncbi:unnamed protein product [Soboliphyme baturini]|uniref:Hypoxia up-regulated protein 1 n=1 Tax=Soboliphyme baturini TaxID=241478 RepID=A0A183ID87_9BILA|nr:unnamed protein product [Soboliphyme baturini]